MSRTKHQKLIMGLTVLVATVGADATLPTFAQSESGAETNVIVVTARNRAELLQDVPLAITAFDSESLARKNITQLEDVARFTSGFSFEDFTGGFAAPVIRGQAQPRVTALESNVSTFYDGVYIPRSWAVDLGTTNLERLEIVKGPQSARYGRNAFAGAINYIPFKARISDDISAEVIGTVGSDERYDAGIKANIPVGDRFAIAGSFNWSTFDGSWENANPFANADLDRGTTGNIGGWENKSFSGSIYANPIDPLELEVSYYRFDLENEARATRTLGETVGSLNCGSVRFGAPSLFCGEFAEPADAANLDPRSFGVHSETGILRVQASWDITESLELSYLFGFIEGDVDIANASEPDQVNCGSAFPGTCVYQNTPIGDIDYKSHEFRLAYDAGGPLRGAIGGFISDGVENIGFDVILAPPILSAAAIPALDGPLSATIPLSSDRTDTDVKSVFAELQWDLPNGSTRVGAEVRYSSTEITTNALNDTFNHVTPRVTVEQDLSDSSLLYATVARGAKAGGFNATAISPVNQVFEEEFNWTYELGSKNEFMGGNLLLNGAIHYTDWSNIQFNSPDPDAANPLALIITRNLGDARVYGLELDAFLQATENLSFDATFSYSNAKYKSGTVDGRLSQVGSIFIPGTPPIVIPIPAPCDDVVCPSNGVIGGNKVERSPSTQVSFGAQWEDDIPQWGASYFVRGDMSWQNEFFSTPANLATVPDRFVLHARAGLTFEHVDVSVWVRNLTDERYVSNSFVVLVPFGNAYQNFFGERRTFGGTLRLSY